MYTNMESNQAAIGLLIIILLIVGANFVMYAIARGAAKGGNSRWMSALKDSLSKPMNTSANKSMDELRKRVEELEKRKEKEMKEEDLPVIPAGGVSFTNHIHRSYAFITIHSSWINHSIVSLLCFSLIHMEAFVNKTIKIILGLFVAGILLAGAFSGGFIVGHLVPSTGQLPVISDFLPTSPDVQPDQQSATPGELQTLFTPFWEAWNIVHEQYVDQPVDDQTLMQGAIRGMMDALGDKQTFYMEPQVYERSNILASGPI